VESIAEEFDDIIFVGVTVSLDRFESFEEMTAFSKLKRERRPE
jgi:hypothetical protein